MLADITVFVLYGSVVVALGWGLTGYMERVYDGRIRALALVERGVYRLAVVDKDRGQHWTAYAGAVFAFNLIGWGFLYLILRLQGITPRASDGLMPDIRSKGVSTRRCERSFPSTAQLRNRCKTIT